MNNKDVLQRSFNFTLNDLECNRNGILSSRQMKTGLKSTFLFALMTTLILLIASITITIYILVTNGRPQATLIGLLLVLLVFKYGHRMYSLYIKGVEEINLVEKGHVGFVDQVKKKSIKTPSENQTNFYILSYNNIELELTNSEYDALEEDNLYRLYFWTWHDEKHKPRGYVLSVEKIRSDS